MIFDQTLFNDLLLNQSLGLFAFFNVIFIWALLKKDYSVIDIAWGLGFVLVSFIAYSLNRSPDIRSLLVVAAITLWGGRLALYLLVRNLGKKAEDYRYAQMREKWGEKTNWHAYFKIFMLQPVLLFIIALPTSITIARSTIPLNILDYLGLTLFLIGWVVETLADYQMSRFKADPANKGKLIRVGVWKRSRHPNYFGEMLVWWGLGFVALNSVFVLIAFSGALMITFLLAKVTGAPLLEAKYKDNPDFETYMKETNAFFPKFF